MEEVSNLTVSYMHFQSNLGGKTISVQVEVVDAPLDYNLLLGRNWFYAMTVVALMVFQTL